MTVLSPYRSAVAALRRYIEAKRASESAPSVLGMQADRLTQGALPAAAVRESTAAERAMRQPKGTRHTKRSMSREYIALGDLTAAWSSMTLYDQLVLELFVIVPEWTNAARRCANPKCRHVRMAGWSHGDGLVYEPMCPLCGGRRTEPVRSKASMAIAAVNGFRRAHWRKMRDGYREGTVPFLRFLEARPYAKDLLPAAWGGVARGAIDRWERELRRRGLI